jgi:hypothetical protein
MTETGTGARKARTAGAWSCVDDETGGEAEILVWNGLVAKAERAAAASSPVREPDDQAETKVCAA